MTMAESYLWLDTYDCGHTQNVEIAVPVDRESRVGEPVVCYVCKAAGEFHVRQRTKAESLGLACPHCGGPMKRGKALLNFGEDQPCEEMQLPPVCTSSDCQAARDDAAIARAIERGIIDP
jgi:hypothetical protein